MAAVLDAAEAWPGLVSLWGRLGVELHGFLLSSTLTGNHRGIFNGVEWASHETRALLQPGTICLTQKLMVAGAWETGPEMRGRVVQQGL